MEPVNLYEPEADLDQPRLPVGSLGVSYIAPDFDEPDPEVGTLFEVGALLEIGH
ncbi:hypothetical protein JL100_035045 (plasmid) [Skermanella mucosa]|uniref:hypothetical protein n=1 Tax=Skermanella mucosa TaxID=1789672 RepID=UPI00192C347D|nr:hypothetical protein [Skermanella mucosa]UEM25280.1 hypothetical protein JL100_035045 [Skermanella mucosa]